MKYINLKQPFVIFWAFALFAFLFSNFNSASTLNLNVHNTYYVVSNLHISLFISIIFFINGLIYFVLFYFKRELYKTLTFIHIIISFSFYFTILAVYLVDSFKILKNFLWIGGVLFIVANIILLVNVIISILISSDD